MPLLSDHPTVKRFNERMNAAAAEAPLQKLDAQWLRQLCVDTGADDVGFVEIDRPTLADQKADIIAAFPRTKTLVSFVCRMNRDNLHSPARSIANLEFHHTGDEVNEIAREIVAALEQRGIRALNPAMGFPMEMQCGRAYPLEQTTNPHTAWRCARQVKTLSAHSSRTAKAI